MAERRLERSEDDRVIAGVCGGIAAYLGSDATWVRIAWIVITILTSVLPMVIIYVVLAAILPTAPRAGSTASAGSIGAATNAAAPVATQPGASTSGRDAAGRPDWGILFGGVLLAVGALLLLAQFVPVRWDIVWPASLIVLGGVIIVVALRPRSR